VIFFLVHGLHQVLCSPKIPVVSSEFESMASDEAPEFFAQRREALIEYWEKSLSDQQVEDSTEAASPLGAESDHESQSHDSGDSATAYDNSGT
jgi:hypothetical protein